MTSSEKSIIKIFSLRKLIIAFFISAGIYFLTYMFFGRADGGIFGIFLMPFYSLFYTAKLFVFALIAGLLLYNKILNNFWFKHTTLYKIILLIASACFIFGTKAANEANYDLNDQKEAQNYLYYLINPSFVVILFALCYRPTKNPENIQIETVQQSEIEIEKENSKPSLKKYTYKCDDGELVIEQKNDSPSSDDTAYLNGKLAPTKKYQIGDKQFVLVSNGNVYATRGFTDN